ncbi:MAG: hypothetical protein VYB54_05775 [Pseudomonadota bacterium]|nr:hypothetical protein [Pseudomonadota bacterium]
MSSCRAGTAVLLAVLASLLVAACGTVPQPFRPQGRAGAQIAAPGPSSALVVRPIEGRDRAPLDALAERLVTRLRQAEIAALTTPLPNRFTLAGEAQQLRVESDRLVLVFLWRLIDPAGTVTQEFRTLETVPRAEWEVADPTLVTRVAEGAGRRIVHEVTGVGAGDDGPAIPEVGFLGVRGASGDGDAVLSAALKSELARHNLVLLDRNWPVGPTVEGHASVRAVDANNDQVVLLWIVRGADGRERGRLEQRNLVPRGRLQQHWGDTARLAVANVAPDLAGLLKQLLPQG